MSIQIIGGGSDLNGAINTSNNNFRDIQSDLQRRVIYDDQGTRVVMLDKDGLKTTAPGSGIDVYTATDAQLTFNSSQDVFKIVSTGTIAVPSASGFTAATGKFNSSNATTTVAHNLGYTPVVIGATSVTTGGVVTNGGILPLTVNGPIGATSGSIFWDYFNIYCDTTNIYLTHTYTGFGGTAGVTFATSTGWNNVKYYLLQETAV